MKKNIKKLRKRVGKLEKRVAELEKQVKPLDVKDLIVEMSRKISLDLEAIDL